MIRNTFLCINLILSINISIGQQVRYSELGSARKGEYSSYVASDQAVYKIGDRIRIGTPSSNKTFAYITEGNGVLLPIENLTAQYSGTETEIKKILVIGGERIGYRVVFKTKGASPVADYTIQFENALSTGEVKGFGMSSDDALAALKKAKDKLDLGLISQEEYDNIKTDLTKYIK